MSFIDAAAKTFGKLAEFKFQAVLFGRDALYIEGGKPIKIDGAEMIFKACGSVITVSGEGLEIVDMADDCVSLVGKVNGFSVSDL